jgi:hypothetical protein
MMPGLLAHAPLEAPMPKSETVTLLRNLNRRVAVIEQILPTLATKDDLKGFPTEADPKGFATKEDLREEGECSRRYMTVLVEAVHDTINGALDVQLGHTRRLDEHVRRSPITGDFRP